MAKISRNAPCPCGSGKKYKKCCLLREGSAPSLQTNITPEVMIHVQGEVQALDNLSNSVVDLIEAGKLDEAQEACRELLERYPDQVDGIERLAMVYEAKNDIAKAAEYYKKTADFMRSKPGFDKEAVQWALEQARRMESALN